MTTNKSPNDSLRGDLASDVAWSDLYDRLRQLAARQMAREKNGHLLQTTAVVHEAYFRLVGQKPSPSGNPSSFLAAAAQTMRRILVDCARREKAVKRGGGRRQTCLSDTQLAVDDQRFAAIDVHDALEKLAEMAPEQARALELMIFGGLTGEEAATVMGVSASTVDRRIRMAKAWLRRELSQRTQ